MLSFMGNCSTQAMLTQKAQEHSILDAYLCSMKKMIKHKIDQLNSCAPIQQPQNDMCGERPDNFRIMHSYITTHCFSPPNSAKTYCRALGMGKTS